jgi:uncharacterized protein YbjT (DUF2867 family)
VRGVTRDPTKPSSKVWTDRGAEMVAGDLDSEDSLKAAFAGANVIFTNSDFWQLARSPAAVAAAEAQGRPVNEIAYDLEVQQQKNMIHAAAATLDSLDLLLFSTLSDARRLSGGKYPHVYHFDSKAHAAEYLRKEQPALAAKTSFLAMPYYIDNWKLGLMQPQKQEDGTFVLRAPINGDRKIPFGLASALAGPFALALAKSAPGKNFQASAGMISFNEWTAKIAKKTGLQVRFEEIPGKVWEDMIPVLGQEFAEMMLYYSDFGYDGGDPTVIYPEQVSFPPVELSKRIGAD